MCMKWNKGFTHGGVFHADDVFATALLKYVNPEIEIYRGFQIPDKFDGIIYDIGFGKYDHHQNNRKIRENGIPYASFGLLWEEIGNEILGKEEAEKFDEDFVQQLDLSDNTGKENILAMLIADRNPTWKESGTSHDARFWEAVDFAKGILEYRFSQILAEKEANHIVKTSAEMAKDRIMYLERPMPWKRAIKETDILYVIYPSVRGGYNIQAVPESEEKVTLKKAFPENLRGKEPEELQKITGIAGFTFCHMSGFLCATDTLEAAYEVAELALKEK